ncbi:MAG: hypothetical protein K2J67_02390 [Lachnospiraceae bacterium]|nr:hypothetical protein [Lachnospiraceae bacterium]
MDRQEEIKRKNQKAEEAMRRARKAQRANEKMQRELQAAARELARHQELARKASMQEDAVREAAAEDRKMPAAAGKTVSAQGTDFSRKRQQNDSQTKRDAALRQQEASREAARQAMIYEAAKRRAEKKEAAKKAAELIAAQKAAEKKVHHTSPETRELQNILLQQITDIMEEKDPEPAPSTEEFGDLLMMDVHGEELQPESSAALEKKIKTKQTAREQDAVQEAEPEAKLETWGRMGTWFLTFCWMHIPIIGFWYMVIVALRKRTPKEKKAFARAYILYRILVLILACTILYIFYRMGLSFLEQILSYMEGHQ